MKRHNHSKPILTIVILLTVVSLVGLTIAFRINRPKLKCNLQPLQKIVPVLYYETFGGLKGYTTHTELADTATLKTQEKHYRTWAKTYPVRSHMSNRIFLLNIVAIL